MKYEEGKRSRKQSLKRRYVSTISGNMAYVLMIWGRKKRENSAI